MNKHSKKWFTERIGKYIYRERSQKFSPLDFSIVAIKILDKDDANVLYYMQQKFDIIYYSNCELKDEQ